MLIGLAIRGHFLRYVSFLWLRNVVSMKSSQAECDLVSEEVSENSGKGLERGRESRRESRESPEGGPERVRKESRRRFRSVSTRLIQKGVRGSGRKRSRRVSSRGRKKDERSKKGSGEVQERSGKSGKAPGPDSLHNLVFPVLFVMCL